MSGELETFPPEYIDKLLDTPGKNINSAKQNLVRQMNRTRKNIVIHDSDLQKAFDVIKKMVDTKTFDLSEYQQKLVNGTPDEARATRHELRVLAILLKDLIVGQESKYRSIQPSKYRERYNKLSKITYSNVFKKFSPTATMIIVGYVVLFAGSGGILGAGLLGASAIPAAVFLGQTEYKQYKIKASEKTLLLLILKLLEEGKQQPIHEQIFTMTNRNTGLTSTAKGPVEMEVNPMFSAEPNARRKSRKTRKSRRNNRR